jgi:SNF2 family DNA or RNA helicase
VAPYHIKGSNSQHNYEAAITQAVGRAARHGQEKTVSVYHLLVKHTVDIDIIEFRNAKVIKQDEFGNNVLESGTRKESKFGTLVYEHIRKQNE